MEKTHKNKKSEVRKMQNKVTVRFENSDYNFIDEQSKKLKISKSDFVRNTYLGRKQKRSKLNSLTSDEAGLILQELLSLTKGINDIQTDVKRIGNNVNQIAKKANLNAGKVNDWLDDLNRELNELMSLHWDKFEVNHGYKQRKN